MRRLLTALILVGTSTMMLSCGPNPDEIVNQENQKLTALEPVEAAKVEEAMSRIRYESDIIARGGVLPVSQDSVATDSIVAPQPAPAPVRAAVAEPRPAQPAPSSQGSFPHHVQLGAFTTAEAAISAATTWENRGFPNVIHMENPGGSTMYRFVVRLTGFTGYTSAYAESQRINSQYGLRSFPVEISP